MVQGIDIVQIDIAFLTYNPTRGADHPQVKLDSTCVAGAFELRKHRELKRSHKYQMGSEAYNHYKWYNKCLLAEIQTRDAMNTKLKIVHWHIESGNIKAFSMNGTLYKAVSIIISPTIEYWYCANTGDGFTHTYGSRKRVDKENTSLSAIENPVACSTDTSRKYCANNCRNCNGHAVVVRTHKCLCCCQSKLADIENRVVQNPLAEAIAILSTRRTCFEQLKPVQQK